MGPDEVRRIARLARLELSTKEESRFAEQLGAIVDYMGRLEAFDPEVEEEAETYEGVPDVRAPCLEQEAFLEMAPSHRGGLLMVPQVKTSQDDEDEV